MFDDDSAPPANPRLPFDLTWAELSAAIAPPREGGDGRPADRVEVITDNPGAISGGGTHAVIVVHRAPELSGSGASAGETSASASDAAHDAAHPADAVFVKVTADPDRREGERYRALSGRVPLPRVLAVVQREADEVLVLERLASVGIEADDVDDTLALLAALSAVRDADPGVFVHLQGRPQSDFDADLLHALRELATTRAVVQPEAWMTAYRRAGEQVATFPTALTHGEFAAQQVGRTRDGRLVMVDLETCFARARLTDLAGIVRQLSALSGRSELELVATWLGLGAPGAGEPVHDVWLELLTTRVVVALEALPWVASEPELSVDGLIAQVHDDLTELGWAAPSRF